jgi:hypothetical protein
MPTEAHVPVATDQVIADRRILRLAFGTSLSLLFSQVVGWDLSFIAPLFSLLLLATPLPPPAFGKGIALVIALVLPAVIGSYVLLPFFQDLHSVAIILVMLALFHSFYLTARGGPAIVGTLLTIGITIVVAIGSVNAAALAAVLQGLAFGAAVGLAFVWIAHLLLPDINRYVVAAGKPAVAKPTPEEARRIALRAFVVVLPVAILFLFSSASASYVVVMIKVASMGQQSEVAESGQLGRSLIASTLWGGVAAIIAWQLISIWPSLILYTLIVAIGALVFGRRIFSGAGLQPDAPTWSYAFLTMIILVAPAVLDGIAGAPAGAAFWSRLVLVLVTSLYGSLAITVFDAFWPLSAGDQHALTDQLNDHPGEVKTP